jgi:poly-gamma-glutamate system protein
MEKSLYNAGIFTSKSVAASTGGGLDKGRGLSPDGRKLIEDAISRNSVEFINEEFIEKSISRRIDIYNYYKKNNRIKAYINVGGGIASLGSTENAEFIPSGLIESLSIKNFPSKGVIIKMAEKNIPIIHLLNITQLAEKFGLPVSPKPIPEPGSGEIFIKRQYNILLTIGVTGFMSLIILAVFLMEKKRHRLGTEEVVKHNYAKQDDNPDL